MRILNVLLLLSAASLVTAQQAPVTRAEFRGLFLGIAKGFVAKPEVNLIPFASDSAAVTKREVALACVELAKAVGRNLVATDNPLQDLVDAKILTPDAVALKYPGANLRPQDLITFLIAFTDGMGNGISPKSWETPSILQPIIRTSQTEKEWKT